MTRFDACLAFTWSPDRDGQPLHVSPGDRGGATSWGVTLASYTSWRADHGHPTTTEVDLAAATKAELGALYRDRYWTPIQGDRLPVGVDLLAFDFGVTSGPGTSVKLLQETVGGLKVDGALGPKTLAAVARCDRLDLIRRLSARHESYYRSLADFSRFGNGWTNRNAARLAAALATPFAAAPAPAPTPATHPGVFASLAGEVRHVLGA